MLHACHIILRHKHVADKSFIPQVQCGLSPLPTYSLLILLYLMELGRYFANLLDTVLRKRSLPPLLCYCGI